jgi:creatinine amidohydrolase
MKYRYAEMIKDEIREAAEQERVAHAGEYETALYLALKRDLVDMTKAVGERAPMPPSFSIGLIEGTHPEGSAGHLWPYWSSITESGVMGDATKATRGKGEIFLDATVDGLVDLIRELKQTPILPRRDEHWATMRRDKTWT